MVLVGGMGGVVDVVVEAAVVAAAATPEVLPLTLTPSAELSIFLTNFSPHRFKKFPALSNGRDVGGGVSSSSNVTEGVLANFLGMATFTILPPPSSSSLLGAPPAVGEVTITPTLLLLVAMTPILPLSPPSNEICVIRISRRRPLSASIRALCATLSRAVSVVTTLDAPHSEFPQAEEASSSCQRLWLWVSEMEGVCVDMDPMEESPRRGGDCRLP
mmetsp:Transcript_39004/g.45459  ORF Transcript_39004/g.45459 Transcript_39004/m.45459 type:complete len:216 (+) Transcript_39004:143-790(+)